MNTAAAETWIQSRNKILIERRTAPVMQHPLDIEAGKEPEQVWCCCCDDRIHADAGYYQRHPMRQMTPREREHMRNTERWCSTECAVSDTVQDWRNSDHHGELPAIFEDIPAYGPSLIR